MRTRRSRSRMWFSTKTRRVSVGMAEAARRGIGHPGLKPGPVEWRRGGGASDERRVVHRHAAPIHDRSCPRNRLAYGQGRLEGSAHFRHIHCGTKRNFRGKSGTFRNHAESLSKVFNRLVIHMCGNDLASLIRRFHSIGVEIFKTGALNHSATCPGAGAHGRRTAWNITSCRVRRHLGMASPRPCDKDMFHGCRRGRNR